MISRVYTTYLFRCCNIFNRTPKSLYSVAYTYFSMYLRFFEKGGKKYYYIAKAVRRGLKVIQKSVLYIGTADSLYEKLIKLKKVV